MKNKEQKPSYVLYFILAALGMSLYVLLIPVMFLQLLWYILYWMATREDLFKKYDPITQTVYNWFIDYR